MKPLPILVFFVLLSLTTTAQRVELSILGGYSFNQVKGYPYLSQPAKIRSGNFATRLMLDFKYLQAGAGFDFGHIRGALVDTDDVHYVVTYKPEIASPYIITHLFANAKLNIDKDRLYFFAGPMLGRITANTEYVEAGNHRGWIYGGQAGVVFHLSETISIDLLHNMRFYTVDNTKYTLPSAWTGPFFRSYTVRMNNMQAGLRIRFRNEDCCKAELPEE